MPAEIWRAFSFSIFKRNKNPPNSSFLVFLDFYLRVWQSYQSYPNKEALLQKERK